MKRLKRTRRLVNRLSEPVRRDEKVPTLEEVKAFVRSREAAGDKLLECVDPEDPANR